MSGPAGQFLLLESALRVVPRLFLRDREASEIPGKMRDDTQTYEPSEIGRNVTPCA